MAAFLELGLGHKKMTTVKSPCKLNNGFQCHPKVSCSERDQTKKGFRNTRQCLTHSLSNGSFHVSTQVLISSMLFLRMSRRSWPHRLTRDSRMRIRSSLLPRTCRSCEAQNNKGKQDRNGATTHHGNIRNPAWSSGGSMGRAVWARLYWPLSPSPVPTTPLASRYSSR